MNHWNDIWQIQLREPLWLLLCLQPLLVYHYRRFTTARQLQRYADAALHPWVMYPSSASATTTRTRYRLYIGAWILLCLALAGPRLPLVTPDSKPKQAIDILILFDISRSMSATDVLPNRLQRGLVETYEFIKRAKGNRFGIIVFAARAHIYVPLTWDLTALNFYLRNLPDLVLPTEGSNPLAALDLANQTLANQPLLNNGQANPAAIVLISDGEFSEYAAGSDPALNRTLHSLQVALQSRHIPVYALGVGSVQGTGIRQDDGSWLKDDGIPVVSHLNEDLLKRLASVGNGRYSPAKADDSDWAYLYQSGILRLFPSEITDDPDLVWLELYRYPLLLALLLLFLSLSPIPKRRLIHIGSSVIGGLLLLLPLPRQAYATDLETLAYQAFQANEFSTALKHYTKVAGYRGRLGQGAALYRLKLFNEAKIQFSDAVITAADDSERAAALFNLGNTQFQLGDYASAGQTYQDVLKYEPTHTPAQHNYKSSHTLWLLVQKALADFSVNMAAREELRAGRGPRQENFDNLAISGDMSLSLDSKSNAVVPLPKLPSLTETALQALVNRGLEHVRIVASGRPDQRGLQHLQDLESARLLLHKMQQQQALLWKDVFETEEGFASAQQQPNRIPGVKAW